MGFFACFWGDLEPGAASPITPGAWKRSLLSKTPQKFGLSPTPRAFGLAPEPAPLPRDTSWCPTVQGEALWGQFLQHTGRCRDTQPGGTPLQDPKSSRGSGVPNSLSLRGTLNPKQTLCSPKDASRSRQTDATGAPTPFFFRPQGHDNARCQRAGSRGGCSGVPPLRRACAAAALIIAGASKTLATPHASASACCKKRGTLCPEINIIRFIIIDVRTAP